MQPMDFAVTDRPPPLDEKGFFSFKNRKDWKKVRISRISPYSVLV
jgi:hypothetical protein